MPDFAVNFPGEPREDLSGFAVNAPAPGGSQPASGMTANISGLPDDLFNKYSQGPTAQLMPADPKKGYGTSYYAAYTNDGDMAGAVMVADGQKVRLVDKMTGDVVFEGVGPEGARLATSVANGISQDLGRKAAWAIQKPSDEGGWVSMAEERYDPKEQSTLGKLADFALPILGAILMPVVGPLGPVLAAGLGSAAGSALSSIAQGRDVSETVKRAAIAGLTAGVGAKVMPMLGNALANSTSPAGQALSQTYSNVMNPLNAGVNAVRGGASAIGDAVFDAAGNLIVRGGSNALTSATGGALGSLAGGATNALTGSSGQNVAQGGSGADTVGNTIEGVDVVGTGADAATGGALGSVVGTGAADTGNTVSEVEVTGTGADTATGGVIGTAVGDVLTGSEGSNTLEDTSTGDDVDKSLTDKMLDWIKANPVKAARLGLTLAGGIGGGAAALDDTDGGGAPLPPGFAAAGTPGSLSDIFRAKLPAPSGPFADLSARNVSMTPEEWKTYGQRSEQSFFNNVPQRPSGIDNSKRAPVNPGPVEPEPGFAVANTPSAAPNPATVPGFSPTAPSSVNSTSGSDMNRGGMTAAQFAVAMKRLENDRRAPPMPTPSAEPERFARGGFAVRGIGSGREDKIPARLSDGEYVIDAETVALLGDGSSDSGAKRLDAFRANIRKHKGKKLVRGEFSVNAKKPEAYLKGGRA